MPSVSRATARSRRSEGACQLPLLTRLQDRGAARGRKSGAFAHPPASLAPFDKAGRGQCLGVVVAGLLGEAVKRTALEKSVSSLFD